MSTEIAEAKVLSEEEQVSLLLENLPSETDIDIDVPSCGRAYFGKKGGTVKIRPVQFGDEKSLASAGRGPEFLCRQFSVRQMCTEC